MDVQIILPPISEDKISDGLRKLTKEIVELDKEYKVSGFLGGEFGYGCAYENDTFMMHPFCWCEREDCAWCMGCDCPESASHHYVDGKEVTYKEYRDFYMLHVYGMTDEQLEKKGINYFELKPKNYKKKAEQANLRRTVKYDAICNYCTGNHHKDKGVEPGKGAPNFWHKKTGLKVWWYKYIGRGMETQGSADISSIIRECISSLKPKRERGDV